VARHVLIAGVALALVLAGCSSASIEEPASCGELRSAWEDAGGPVANYSVQVRTVERVTELGGNGETGPEERATCAGLFDDAYAAANCTAPDVRPEYRYCAEG
jgi:hypothetical protein